MPHIKDSYTLLLPQFPGTFVVHLLDYTKGSGGGGGEYSLWTSENKLGGVTDFVTGFGTRATAVTVQASINNKLEKLVKKTVCYLMVSAKEKIKTGTGMEVAGKD